MTRDYGDGVPHQTFNHDNLENVCCMDQCVLPHGAR